MVFTNHINMQKKNVAIKELEERGKPCWHVAYHRAGENLASTKKPSNSYSVTGGAV